MTGTGYFVLFVVCLLVLNTCKGDSCAKQMMSMKLQQKTTNKQLEEIGKKLDMVLSIVQQLQNQSVVGPCHAAYQDFTSNGNPAYEPRCDEEGFFQPVQLYDDMAFCVTRNGNSLGYEVPAMMAHPENDCACALAGRYSECADDGSYRQYDDFMGGRHDDFY
ncbi:hypothetical protein DPMN_080232 [Dreissena polymorpha]|uniref:Thyroglobulin type-1 domain-containing protein n=2 Tax=Dreissena polymorpha TaxID=45954 RepID=A0A9D4BTN7_DREPO|nr:hypothetical protein DPMN_080232 [Dreissena polymorpha]